jgi:hypothetical protein
MDNYRLGKPFGLGEYGRFTAPQSGQLYLRCQDEWNQLADNRGSISVDFRLVDGTGSPGTSAAARSPTSNSRLKPASAESGTSGSEK